MRALVYRALPEGTNEIVTRVSACERRYSSDTVNLALRSFDIPRARKLCLRPGLFRPAFDSLYSSRHCTFISFAATTEAHSGAFQQRDPLQDEHSESTYQPRTCCPLTARDGTIDARCLEITLRPRKGSGPLHIACLAGLYRLD